MKRILFLTILLSVCLIYLTDGSVALGQNMATESYNPNSPWHRADNTGYYNMERCPICNEFIISYEEASVYENMGNHISTKHPEFAGNNEYDYSNTETGGGTEGSSSNDNESSSSEEYTYVVDIEEVAHAMSKNGICDASWFIEEYNTYYGYYVANCAVPQTYLDAFIKRKFPLMSNISLSTAIHNNYPFLILSKSSSSGVFYTDTTNLLFYKVIHNGNINYFHNFHYQYLYVFSY